MELTDRIHSIFWMQRVKRHAWQSPPVGLWALVLSVLWLVSLAGCGSSAPSTQVCHEADDSGPLQVVTVGSEAELQEHLAHGDAVFGTGLNEDCTGDVTFRVDTTIETSQPTLPGLRGGRPRRIGAFVGPDGTRDEYLEDELEVRFETKEGLESFLNLYGATVLREDLALIADEEGEVYEVPDGANGWYLVRIDAGVAPLLDLPTMAVAAGFAGDFSVSSDTALRTFAAFLREQEHRAAPNLIMEQHALLEHPVNNTGDYVDMSTMWWMTQDDDGGTPGEQGLSVGVARAFDYLRHTNLPPQNGTWEPARVAIIDNGFDLDPATGLGNRDYFNNVKPPMQVDLEDYDGNAGGPNPGATGKRMWHGQLTFGVAAALPRNTFGGAGTGGEYARPIIIKTPMTRAGIASSIRTAYLMQADVINISLGQTCNWLCDVEEFFDPSHLQDEITNATVWGSVIFTSAGNGPDNRTQDYNIDNGAEEVPCEMDKVICVGAVDTDGNNKWNWGNGVDIWAPTDVLSTVIPTSASKDADDFGIDEVSTMGGTSCASPFAAGVAALLKTAQPDLRWDEVLEILQSTANRSSDAKVSTGYVDAYRAVEAVRANPAPTVRLAFLLTNGTYSPVREHEFSAHVSDEPAPGGFVGKVEFYSDLDGLLCGRKGDANFMSCKGRLPTQGTHTITAIATDAFGATATSEPVQINVENGGPSVVLVTPDDGSTHYTDQRISFRATVHDVDGENFEAFCPGPDFRACIEWSSDIDGVLTSSGPFDNSALDFSSVLSEGTHTITVTARDQFGASATERVTVTVEAGRGQPTARILTPLGEFTWRESTMLLGTGSDPEDGSLPTRSLEWYSSVDGFLGTGGVLWVDLTGPKCEDAIEHLITLRVTDSDGNVSTDEVRVTFHNIC